MERHEGLVVGLGKGLAVVLTPDGQFRRVRAQADWQLGAEVRLDHVVTLPRRQPRALTWVAAAAILLAMLLPGALSVRTLVGQGALAAYVAVDINPSLELQVSAAGKVLDTSAVNDDAAQLMQELNLRGLLLDQAMRQITEKAIAAGYLTQTGDNMVLITVTSSAADGSVSAGVTQRVQASEQAVQAVLTQHQLPNAVETLTAPAEVRTTAKSQGLSTGKLLVASEAAAAGVNISSEELKQQPLGKILARKLTSTNSADKRAILSDFLTRVKGKDHENQKDMVKAVDDLVRSWKEKDDGKHRGDNSGNNAGDKGDGNSRDRKDATPAQPQGAGKKPGQSDPNGSQPAQKSDGEQVAPAAPQKPAVSESVESPGRDNTKDVRGKRRKGADGANGQWPEQFREFFERIFGKASSHLGSDRGD